MIFSLPPHLERLRSDLGGAGSSIHLAYIEWFSPFLPNPEPDSLLYRVSRSYANRARKAAVIPVSSIARSCHLVPVWGLEVDRSWTSYTVLDQCDDFHLNSFVDHHMYYLTTM